MARMVNYTLVLLLILTLSTLASCQIHRAKRDKSGSKAGSRLSGHESQHGLGSKRQQTKKYGHSRETWIYSIVSAMLVGLSGVFPLLVIPIEAGKALRKGAAAAHLKLLLSFAVGGLLGDVFLHLLPEAWIHVTKNGNDSHTKIGLWVLAGIFTFLIVEKIFPDGKDEDEDEDDEAEEVDEGNVNKKDSQEISYTKIQNGTIPHQRRKISSEELQMANGLLHPVVKNGVHKHQNGTMPNKNSADIHVQTKTEGPKRDTPEKCQHIKTSGWLNLLANVIDNFTHGLAVAGSYCIGTKSGVLTTIIILLHEIPHEVGDFAILLRSGFDHWKAAKAQLLTASGGILGALTALGAESAQSAGNSTAWILPFTSGGFIYIALVTVVPDLLKEQNPWESLKQLFTLCAGIGTMAVVALWLDEHDLPSLPSMFS